MEREAGKSGTNEKRGSALSKRRRGLLASLRFVTRFEFGAARVGDSVRTGNLRFQFGMKSQKTSPFSLVCAATGLVHLAVGVALKR